MFVDDVLSSFRSLQRPTLHALRRKMHEPIPMPDAHPAASQEVLDELRGLGLHRAATVIGSQAHTDARLAPIKARYAWLDADTYATFAKRLYAKDLQMKFTLVADYPRVPPRPVLDALAEARATNLFCNFAVAEIEKRPDPILFGMVGPGLPDRWTFASSDPLFFIAQWGQDVTFADMLAGRVEQVAAS
jgi:hypothetical protein